MAGDRIQDQITARGNWAARVPGTICPGKVLCQKCLDAWGREGARLAAGQVVCLAGVCCQRVAPTEE